MLDQKSKAVMRGDLHNYRRSPCWPVTHFLSYPVVECVTEVPLQNYRKLLTHFVECSLYARGKLSQASFFREFQKNEVMIMFVVGGQLKNQANTSYKATKLIERTFLISDC